MVGHHGFPCTGQRRTDGEVVSDFSNMCYLNSSGNPQLASNMRVWTCRCTIQLRGSRKSKGTPRPSFVCTFSMYLLYIWSGLPKYIDFML